MKQCLEKGMHHTHIIFEFVVVLVQSHNSLDMDQCQILPHLEKVLSEDPSINASTCNLPGMIQLKL